MEHSNLVIVGVNHKNTPVELRERLAFTQGTIEESSEKLNQYPEIEENLIISTCNRVEIYARVNDINNGVLRLKRFISDYHQIPIDVLDEHFYSYTEDKTIEHLFRVSASLDSMIVGEAQILGQVKDAYSLARSLRTTGIFLNQLFEKAFNVAKRIREETGIAESAVSISSAAVELARKIFDNLENHTVMLVGTGEMAELAARHLMTYGLKTVYVASRTYERAAGLAKTLNGSALGFDEFKEELYRADIVISSTAAPNFIITKEMVDEALHKRKNRSMFLIDIAVPRDIAPEVNDLENVYLYDIDDLQSVVDANMKEREKEAELAMEIIHSEVVKFNSWIESRDAVPTIVGLRRKAEDIRRQELDKTLKRLEHLSTEDKSALEQMTLSIINKILHKPTVNLKEKTRTSEGQAYLKAIRDLFHLDD
ncbi:glutamyl-tRNA reductase [Nitrospina sp. 32_T5]|uniref:glutamyl-tRNA reductase n=1 Tax=unclassified Nitrospina TaxID=2638683 RepID=UPI003F9E9825